MRRPGGGDLKSAMNGACRERDGNKELAGAESGSRRRTPARSASQNPSPPSHKAFWEIPTEVSFESRSQPNIQLQKESSKASAEYQPSSGAALSNKEVEEIQSQSSVTESPAVPVLNGVQPVKHENGLSSKGEATDFEEIITLSNHSGSNGGGREKPESDVPAEPILAFEGGEPFLKKAGTMKPQHVAVL
ncbi:hypothetical protein SKAU_G00112710 [Synaphobranchus kaupii]|uniref:Uncharacterized protein n=1 Tax=Synaphobranchus kaupii TaxID=118154 RepID=A0A9Q1G0N2_SYNKA|nr:hypothetical protein SKAU_G00112710 [Synaphobranchus kaupii]